MKKNLNLFLDFDEFNFFPIKSFSKYTALYTGLKKSSPSKRYFIKIFKLSSLEAKIQDTILQTFYENNSQKIQYLICYKHLSFSHNGIFNPIFSMGHVSTTTLSNIFKSQQLKSKITKHDTIYCLFAVAKGMSYLHEHLICHGNLCPNNIIVDCANQFYICDYGLYKIKKLYVSDSDMYDKDYKDPKMSQKGPVMSNDVYSFGVLMCEICLSFFYENEQLSLQQFLAINDENKYKYFPSLFADLIPKCLNSTISFKQILSVFQKSSQIISSSTVENLYEKFNEFNYIVNLADKNDPVALNKLGKMYENGINFEMDLNKALQYYGKAANLNYSKAQKNLGVLMQKMANNDFKKLAIGASFLKQSAEQGDIRGMAVYGVALMNGNGVRTDFKKAEKYLKNAADLGDSNSQVNYGIALLKTNQSISRINEGLKYIKKAIEKSNPYAFYMYGLLLREGKYLDEDYQLAMDYFKIAADMGNVQAMIEYADGSYKGIGVQKNSQIALKYLQNAASEGSTTAAQRIEIIKNSLESDQRSSNNDDPHVEKFPKNPSQIIIVSSSSSSDEEDNNNNNDANLSSNHSLQSNPHQESFGNDQPIANDALNSNENLYNVKTGDNFDSNSSKDEPACPNDPSSDAQAVQDNHDEDVEKSMDLDLPVEELIKEGDTFREENCPEDALIRYEAAAGKGCHEAYLKCADVCSSFELKLEYYEKAIKNEIDGAFSQWRKCILKRISQSKDKELLVSMAQKFELFSDFSDAAFLYKKVKDQANFISCYEAAKLMVNSIQDGSQQYRLALLCENQKEIDMALLLFKKAFDNGVEGAEKKIKDLSKAQK